MDHTPSVVHRTTRSWFHEEIEKVVRRCCEQVLAETLVESTGGRPAELPDLSLWMAVIVVVLRGLCSQRAIWRLLAGGGLWAEPCYAICDQTIYSRLSRHGSGPLPALFVRITELLRQWQAPALESYEQHNGTLAPFAREVVAIDAQYTGCGLPTGASAARGARWRCATPAGKTGGGLRCATATVASDALRGAGDGK